MENRASTQGASTPLARSLTRGRPRRLGVLLAEVRVRGSGTSQWTVGGPPAVPRNEIPRKRMHVSHARAAANDGNVSVCLKDRCEQVYERRQQTSKGPDKRRNREST